jgi:hypothetical protein
MTHFAVEDVGVKVERRPYPRAVTAPLKTAHGR